MPAPGENSAETILSPDALAALGTGEITDPAVRQDVVNFLKERPKLLDDIKVGNIQAREYLAGKIREINNTKQAANEMIKGIVETLLQKIAVVTASLPPLMMPYFVKGSADIRNMMAVNAIAASDAAQKLLAEANTAAASAVAPAPTVASTQTPDPSTITPSPAVAVTAAAGAAGAASAPSPLAAPSGAPAVAPAPTPAPATAPAPAPALAPAPAPEAATPAPGATPPTVPGTADPASSPEAPAAPAEEPEPEFSMATIGPWLKWHVNNFKKTLDDAMGFMKSLPGMLGGILGIFGVKSALGAPSTGPDDPKMEKVKKLLKEIYKLTADEFTKLKEIKLKDFLEMASEPSWMDKNRFEKLKKDLAFNKKDTDNTDVPLLDFMTDKDADWKEAPPDATSGTP